MKKSAAFRMFLVVSALAVLGLLAGCFETTQEFTLNPDGSGKVVHESKFQTVDLTGSGKSSEAQAKKAVADFMRKARGVDAWRDVSVEALDDGRIHFKGTAYFKNLSQLELPEQTMLEFDWTASDDHTGALSLRNKQAANPKKATSPAASTPAAIKEARAKYQQAKPMMAMIIGSMKQQVVFHLPGRRGELSGFQPDASGGVALQFDGARVLTAIETLMNNDDWMARHPGAMDPDSGPPTDEEANQLLFGSKQPVGAKVSGLTAASFDYDAEVAAAREAAPELQQQLGSAAVPLAPPASGGELKSVKVVGVRLVQEVDESLEVRPLDTEAGYTLALLVELPGSVHAVTDESGLDSALASDGSDLLPESDFQRRFSFPKLAANKAAVVIDARLRAPGPGVTGLKELSGHLQYTVAGETQETDLGFAKFAAGSKGKALGAEIKALEPKAADGSQQIELQLNLDPDAIKALYLVTGSEKTELNRNGYSGYNDEYTYTYTSEKGFPAKSRLVAEVYGNLQTFEATFKLENLTLLGESAAAK